MAIPGYDELVYYATPPNSYIGATIFLSYIVAALYATFTITYSLYTQYNTLFNKPYRSAKDVKRDAAKVVRARHIKIYAFLASISFAILSYHMLMFLVTHYLEWAGDKNRSLSDVSGDKLKKWMLESTLFQDFAKQLVKDAPNAVWTQAAILATWFWNIWMGQKARQRKFDASTMRTYISLSQILPISFTVTLFIIQLHLASPEIQPPTPVKDAAASQLSPGRRKPLASLQLPNVLLNASLLALPSLRSHSIFSIVLLFGRAILLLPHSELISLPDSEIAKCITVSGGFAIANAAMIGKILTFRGVVGALGNGGYAMKALGWDAVLGLIVYAVLGWGGGV